MKNIIATLLLASSLSVTTAAKPDCNQGNCESTWKNASLEKIEAAQIYGEGYKGFLDAARTELAFVAKTKAMVETAGFKPWTVGTKIKAGDKYYHSNRDRAMLLIIGGKDSVSKGVRIIASHIDSPRLELKGRPLYEKEGFALFQTNYHGGIKTYQWTNIPLALVGRVDKKDGTTVQINIGLKASDPIFMIPDLSPHTARDQMKKTAREVVSYEQLDPIIASGPTNIANDPTGKMGVEERVLDFLKHTYKIDAADLVSAELSLVPATRPRDMGIGRRLMAVYGQDDRLAGYASIRAAIEADTPQKTALIHLADNEESGNNNVTGASSTYLIDLIGELVYAEQGSKFRQPMVTRALRASKALSIDVNPGVNPMDPGAWEIGNAPKLGYGVNIKLYGRGFDAASEFIAWTRSALDSNKVPWQTSTYKVGRAGGGTLGRELARQNIDTIDFGVPVLSIHTPYAVSDKMDGLAMKNGIKAFISHN